MRAFSVQETLAVLVASGRSLGASACHRLRRFVVDRRASIAINFALTIIPMILSAGVAIDLSRAMIVHSRLSSALDSAGLAVGRAVNISDADAKILAQNFFNANYPATEMGVPGQLQVTINGDTIQLSVSADMPTTFMKIAGFDKLDVSASSTVTREATGLELALVLDTTGSMAQNSKIDTLKTAATDLVNTLFGSSVFPENLKIGIVPFAEAVRLDPATAVNNGWIDTKGASDFAKLNFTVKPNDSYNKYAYAYCLYSSPSDGSYSNSADCGGSTANMMANTPWLGCVETRPNQLDETDTPPSSTDGNTRWVPMFQPDEPHVSEAENNSSNPAGPNQTSISSNYSHDYITNQLTLSTQQIGFATLDVLPMRFSIQSQSNSLFQTINSSGSVVNHGFSGGEGPVRVSSSGTLPAPLSSSTNYWIIRNSNSRFNLSTTKNGTKVTITSAGSGTFLLNTLIANSPTTHSLTTGDGPIRFRTTGTLPGNVSSGTNYWVVATTTSHIQLAATKSDANAATPITVNFTSAGSGTDVTNALISASHGLSTGDGPVTLTGTLPSGLSTGTNYWITKVNANAFQLATSQSNATASPPTVVDLTGTGSSGKVVVPGVNVNADTLYAPNHGRISGDGPVRLVSTGTLPGGTDANTDYWITKVDTNYVKLAISRANALAGLPVVDLTSLGSGTIYTAESPGHGVTWETLGGTSLNDQRGRQANWEKYAGQSYTGTNGPYRACAMQPILAMTNDKSAILAKVNALNPAGNTHIPVGLAWGWRLVSPDAPYTEGVSYNNHAFQKAIVLMTDGDNTMPTESSTLNASDYTAYGYASQARMGTGIDTTSEMETEMGMNTGTNSLGRICNAIKGKDIRLYTIAVQISNTNTKNMLKSCATVDSGNSLYFDAQDNTQLAAAFKAIATDLSNLRISK